MGILDSDVRVDQRARGLPDPVLFPGPSIVTSAGSQVLLLEGILTEGTLVVCIRMTFSH